MFKRILDVFLSRRKRAKEEARAKLTGYECCDPLCAACGNPAEKFYREPTWNSAEDIEADSPALGSGRRADGETRKDESRRWERRFGQICLGCLLEIPTVMRQSGLEAAPPCAGGPRSAFAGRRP